MSAEPKLHFAPEAAAPAVQWLEGELALPHSFTLESGATLDDARLAWTCVGPAEAPVVVVLGGISAHRRPVARDGRGWWESQCGAGKALDTNRYRLVGIDWLGGCDASTGPRSSGTEAFPEVSTGDQARALLLLLNRLGVRRVHLVVGASYGGNVAQHLAALLGERLRHLVLLSAAHKAAQFGLALRHVQRAILDLGSDSAEALALARSLAVLGYRTAEGVERRFGGESPVDAHDDGVIGWVEHHGRKFVRRFDADAYRCLGRSLDRHEIDPAAVRVPTTLFAVREDLTVPLSLSREYVAHAGAPCELVEISSDFGHDAFLKEEAVVSALFERCLQA
ncbi:MAG: alpha/beta fold hydrolase [Rudaea sp.]|uniref:alpha/beta fold hydrolase n=1 Tax=Rudaea sp. TaxID=2136325 RepID=UPI0039E6B340